jgi:transcriptional regulator with XRE-family HTH domain
VKDVTPTAEVPRKRKPPKKGVDGSRMKALREASGLTQQELAVRAETNVGVIAAIEQGKTPDPRFSTMRDIAKALGVTLNDLVSEPS